MDIDHLVIFFICQQLSYRVLLGQKEDYSNETTNSLDLFAKRLKLAIWGLAKEIKLIIISLVGIDQRGCLVFIRHPNRKTKISYNNVKEYKKKGEMSCEKE